MTPGAVYVACPVGVYGTRWASGALARVRRLVAPSEVIDPAQRWADRADWLTGWPVLVEELVGLVVVTPDGLVGAGVVREVADAIAARAAVAVLDGPWLVELRSLDLCRPPDPRVTATVVGGCYLPERWPRSVSRFTKRP